MADLTSNFDWQSALVETYTTFFRHVIEHIPQLLGALLLLIIGAIAAHLLRIATRKLVNGLDLLFKHTARAKGLEQIRIRRSYALISSQIVFWVVLIFFIAAASNMLGWKLFSTWLQSIVAYIPNLVTGLLIILAGFLLSQLVHAATSKAAVSAGLNHPALLARFVQAVTIFTAIVIGVEQLGINVGFLTTAMLIIGGVLLSGAAIAFGLGAKTFVANLIGAQLARKHCRIGEKIKIDHWQGELIEVTQTSLILDTADGRTAVPAKMFHEHVSVFTDE